MRAIDSLKESVKENLENFFINKKEKAEKEMNLLNVLISTFCDNTYTYDEYCRNRMSFEIEACDKGITVDLDSKIEFSDLEKIVVQNQAVIKQMKNKSSNFDEILKEEYIQHMTKKCYEIDKKLFYQISKYSSLKLLKNKIPDEIWENKKDYFDSICENKANNFAIDCANNNKKIHEQDIRTSMI